MSRLATIAAVICALLLVEAIATAAGMTPQSGLGTTFYLAFGGSTIVLAVAWSALGPGPWLKRALVGVSLAMGHNLVLTLACVLTTTFLAMKSISTGMWLLGLFFFCLMHAPLWLLREVRGWRIVHVDDLRPRETERPIQFNIRQLMIATAVFAFMLVATQVGLNLTATRGGFSGMFNRPELQHWVMLFIYSLLLAVFHASLAIPGIRASLASTRFPLWISIYGTASFASVFVFGIVISVINNPQDPFPGLPEGLGITGTLVGGFLLSFLTGTLTLRALGYRLSVQPPS